MYNISDEILSYGDVVSASVILFMGIYLLWLVFTDRINLNKHIHNGKEHIHIYFGKEHKHSNKDVSSAFTIGTLMGIGGVRGMLVTLGMVEASKVDFTMVLSFTLGVMLIFVVFGAFILYINKNLLNSKENIKRVFTVAGIISVIVGINFLLA
jgi:ABC-type nickel/cobalt efflux system permease component RcnA